MAASKEAKKTTQYPEGFERLRRKKAVKSIRRRVLTAVLLVVLCAFFFLALVGIFFRVSAVEVRGNTVYNDQDIIDASGIEYGRNIYLLNTDAVAGAITSGFPFIKTVKLERNVPSTVILNVECDEALFYIDIGGEYFVVSREMRVIGRDTSLETLLTSYPGIKRLVTSPVAEAVVGRQIVFARENYFDTVKDFLDILEASEAFEGLTTVDVSDKFSVSLVYDHRLRADMGDTSDADLKLRFMYEIIKDLGTQSGTIDIEDVEMGYVILSYGEVYD